MKFNTVIILTLAILLAPYTAWAEVMSSTNYYIQLDSFSSGARSTSTNYTVIDAIGQAAIDETSTSTNYQILDGLIGSFQDGVLTASVSVSSVDLGELSTDSVSSGSATVTVTTDAISGYTVRISEDGELRDVGGDIDDVTDGEVTAGVEEYGVGTSGSAGSYNTSDTSITSALKTVVSNSDAVASQQTTVTFKASIGAGTDSGSYSHTVTFSTVSNF